MEHETLITGIHNAWVRETEEKGPIIMRCGDDVFNIRVPYADLHAAWKAHLRGLWDPHTDTILTIKDNTVAGSVAADIWENNRPERFLCCTCKNPIKRVEPPEKGMLTPIRLLRYTIGIFRGTRDTKGERETVYSDPEDS